MSGNEQAGLLGDGYRLHLSGGITTQDYERVRANQERLSEALRRLQPALDAAFAQEAQRLGLHVQPYADRRSLAIDVEQWIDATSFRATLTLRVRARVPRERLTPLLEALVRVLSGSPELQRLLN